MMVRPDPFPGVNLVPDEFEAWVVEVWNSNLIIDSLEVILPILGILLLAALIEVQCFRNERHLWAKRTRRWKRRWHCWRHGLYRVRHNLH